MKQPHPLIISLFGNVEQTGSERYFMSVTCLTASVFLFGLCIVHLLMGLKIAPVIVAGSSSALLLGLYFLVRFGKYLYYPKLVLSVLGLVLLDITWYSKFLSNGPVLFFVLIFGALVLWVWEGRPLLFLLIFYYLNIAALFFIEHFSPEALLNYPEGRIRSVDIYLSFILYSGLLIFLLFIIKKDFIRQKEGAIRSDKLKSAFLANMSHEIRTPMNSIVGFSQLLNEENNAELRMQHTEMIQRSSNNLMGLINDIIDLSKIETGDFAINYSDFSVNNLLQDLEDSFTLELMNRKKVDVKLRCVQPEETIMLHSDYLRLNQVLSNLLSNAVKFTTKGEINLNFEKSADRLVFSVSDTGTGIQEEDKSRIFRRFTSFNYLGMNVDGTGIGLSIAEKILEKMEGRIWFKSTFGEGSTFYVSIPDLKSKKKYSRTADTLSMNRKVKKPKGKILVVEDDIGSQELISLMLKPLQIEVSQVSDGRDAVNYIMRTNDVSLILMDIKLPHMDGYEAASTIKKIKPEIPVIAQTAYAMVGDKEKALKAGFDDYLTKPLNVKKLLQVVQSYI